MIGCAAWIDPGSIAFLPTVEGALATLLTTFAEAYGSPFELHRLNQGRVARVRA
jgi:hypothetical protein